VILGRQSHPIVWRQGSSATQFWDPRNADTVWLRTTKFGVAEGCVSRRSATFPNPSGGAQALPNFSPTLHGVVQTNFVKWPD